MKTTIDWLKTHLDTDAPLGAIVDRLAAATRRAIAERDVDLGRDPEGNVAADLAVEDRIEAERQIEAAARGRDEQ